MKTTTHTPLPWKISAMPTVQGNAAGICSADGLHVTDIRGYGNTIETDKANASLIVRSVNSHAELVSLVQELLIECEACQRTTHLCINHDTFAAKAKSALSKAKS